MGLFFKLVHFKIFCRKLINVKIMKNNEICCFFVTGNANDNKNWEQYIQTVVLKDLNIVPSILEMKPLNKAFN